MTAVYVVRRKEVRLSFELVQHLLTEGMEFHARIVEGLPAGARLVRIDVQGAGPDAVIEPTAQAVLVFEHESFEPTPPGDHLPEKRIDVERVHCPPPGVEERTAIRVTPNCSACGDPAYIVALDFLTWLTKNGLFARLPAGVPRYGCPAHQPRQGVEVTVLSKEEALDLLARPLALQQRINEATGHGARE